jgi:SAM-dependent methyltransferase
MRHLEAAAMIEGAGFDRLVPATWADLGCGDGTFTLALASLLAPGSLVHAIDRDPAAIAQLPASASTVRIAKHVDDFRRSWPFSTVLDGILMANSLHYVQDQRAFLQSCLPRVSPAGRFLIVEYDTTFANPWVPFPINRARLTELCADIGTVTMLGTRRSTFRRAKLYAALVSRRSSDIS